MIRPVRAASLLALLLSAPAVAAPAETWSLHGQATLVWLYQPQFHSPFQGANSLDPVANGRETFDLTIFAGARLWDGGEVYINPEVDQGFGLSNTVGVAGYPSGEAYKVGKEAPYFRLQRLFLRQTFDLGGDSQAVDPGANQLGGTRSADNLVLTGGKFSVTDIFDTNSLAHDPKSDFLNWSLIDTGAFDYAAMPGATATASRRNGRRIGGRCGPACSTCRGCPTRPSWCAASGNTRS